MTPSPQGNYPKNHLQCNKVSTTCMSKKPKEPRFVPYEPYKAAVTPLVNHAKSRQPKFERNTNALMEHSVKPSNKNKTKLNHPRKSDEQKAHLNENMSQDDKKIYENGDNSKIENLDRPTDYQSLQNAEKLLVETNKKLAESEKQLRIQIQVCFVIYHEAEMC